MRRKWADLLDDRHERPRNIAVAENRASAIAQLQSVLHGVGMIGRASAAYVRAFGIRPAAASTRLLTLPRPRQTCHLMFGVAAFTTGCLLNLFKPGPHPTPPDALMALNYRNGLNSARSSRLCVFGPVALRCSICVL